MTDGALITGVHFSDARLIVSLGDGRQIATPLTWYPILANATQAQRDHFEISPFGIHWPDLDEDLSLRGMLTGESAARRAAL